MFLQTSHIIEKHSAPKNTFSKNPKKVFHNQNSTSPKLAKKQKKICVFPTLTVIPPFPPTLPTPHTVSLLLLLPPTSLQCRSSFPSLCATSLWLYSWGPSFLAYTLTALRWYWALFVFNKLVCNAVQGVSVIVASVDRFTTQFMTIVMNRVVMALVMCQWCTCMQLWQLCISLTSHMLKVTDSAVCIVHAVGIFVCLLAEWNRCEGW